MIGLSFHFCSGCCNLEGWTYGREDHFNHENDVTLLFVCHALTREHESTMSMDPERGFGVCLASTQLYRKMI